MTETDAILLFKCLADRSRLQILKNLMQEDLYTERLAERLGLSAATISFHMKKLIDAGAVTAYRDQYYTMYSLRRELFDTTMLEIIREKSDEAQLQALRDEAYRQKVLSSFFRYGKLVSIPTQRKKERICLEEIAKSLEPGRPYPEPELNEILLSFHEDYCTLRRDMISEKLLTRDGSVYIRII